MPLPSLGSPRSPSLPGLRTAMRAGFALALTVSVLSAAGQVPATAATAAATATPPLAATVEQELAVARSSGKAVEVPGATTSASTLTANPDGTLTSTQTVAPVRKYVAGAWKDLDATLHANPDGSLSPAVTTSLLTLSGGGSGPLAQMSTGGRDLAISAPVSLPTPTLEGSSALYTNVLSGVDLQVSVTAQGGFSETLVVHDAQAATNPVLKTLIMPVRASHGVSLASDAAGNITAHGPGGQPMFTAPAPIMWDSTPSTATSVADPTTGQRVDARSGDPIDSSAQSPGENAKTASLAAKATSSAVTLTPSVSLMSSSGTVFPVYIDPTWNPHPAGSKTNSWTEVNSAFPSTSYWKTSSWLQAGYNGWEAPYFVTRSLFNVSVSSAMYGATVLSSKMTIPDEWSPSCTAKPIELWKTGKIDSSTDWSNQPSWISKIDSATAAHGYDSSCPAADIPFDTTSIMQSAAAGKWSNLTMGLRAGDESDKYGWKKFSDSPASFSTTYDHTPNTPTTLSTSPATACTGTLTTVGDGDVSLYAGVSDPDNDPIGATFSVSKASTGDVIVTSSNGTPNSGPTAVYIVKRALLETAAAGVPTKISWKVQATDYKYSSSWSTCSFTFDPTRPGAPNVPDPHGEIIGTPTTFTIAPAATGTAPASYTYQLNGAAPLSVAATGAATTISLTPPRYTNTLTVTSLSAGGNIGGDIGVLVFDATAAAAATDNDLTGDGIPDLLTAGATNGLPSGLWLNTGQAGTGHSTGDGQIIRTATDIGSLGTGIGDPAGPANFDGTQVISGHFTGGGLQDLLTYYPNNNLTPQVGNYESTPLSTPSPDGTNWNAWSITTAQTATGTAMFLSNPTTHALYLWQNPAYDYGNATFTPGTQYLLSTTFAPAAGAHLQAADINGDGTPDLWATNPGPTTTAYLLTNLATTPTLTAQPTQTLLTSNHTWPLNDSKDTTLATATDATSALNLTGTTGVTGHTGDLFTPDANFNGTTGVLNTTAPAIATNTDFTVSAWVNPTTANGAIFSQEGAHASGLSLSIDPTTGKWLLSMAQTDAKNATTDTNLGRVAPLSTWTHLAVTYKASTGSLTLYIDGIDYRRVAHTTKINTTGQFHIGNYLLNDAQTGYFKGQIANVQTWNQTLTPTEIAQQSGTPGYVLFESDNTNYTSPHTWTTAHGKMTFTAGLLSIIETNNANKTLTYGATGHTSAALTVQSDGNTVIYPQAAHTGGTSLWSTTTSNHPNDAMFFQPDGNLVLYDADGTVLWTSGTNN